MSDAAKILVVDDDPLTQRVLVQALQDGGYEIETASDGVQAVERVRLNPPDLLILDVVMPKMNGLEVCRIVKASSETFVPIILVTVRGDMDSKVTGLKLGADDYLSKPVNPLELQARVVSMLRIKALQDKLVARRHELEAISITDELTGLNNHRAMQQRLRDEFLRAQRYNEPLSVVMIDMDYFKRINDTLGHQQGDRVLARLAQIFRAAVREIDIVTRYGGDEFLIILPQTHFSGALTVATRIARGVNAETIDLKGETVNLSVSIGVAIYPNKHINSAEDMAKYADQALYQAKSEGRNRICLHQHQNFLFRADNASV